MSPVATEQSAGMVDVHALCAMLGLSIGEAIERAYLDARSGDYRVYHVALTPTEDGGMQLAMELHRQGPGFTPRIIPALQLRLAMPDAHGLAAIASVHCDAAHVLTDIASALPRLAAIIAELKKDVQPLDTLIAPFLSRAGNVLWTRTLPGVAA